MPFTTTRQYDIPEENAKGTPLKEGTDSFIGLRHKQSENMPDTFQPYTEDFADKAKTVPGVKPALQGPNEQSIVASGMTVEEWKFKHPKAVLGPNPEDIGQITTDPPDDSEPEKRPIEDEMLKEDDAASGETSTAPAAMPTSPTV